MAEDPEPPERELAEDQLDEVTGGRGNAVGSPGVLSGNVIQVPVHIPIDPMDGEADVFNPGGPGGSGL